MSIKSFIMKYILDEPVPETKSIPFMDAASGWFSFGPGSTQSMRGFNSNVQSGYCSNPYAYRAVNLIATAVSRVPWELDSNSDTVREDDITSHPVIELLKKPNDHSGTRLIERVVTHMLLSGDAYLLAIGPGPRRPPLELHALQPDLVNIEHNSLGLPYYVYGKTEYTAKQILHLSTINPLDVECGVPTMQPASASVLFNSASRDWNAGLLNNGGKVSGALIASGDMSDPQYTAAKEMLRQEHTGASNAGKMMLLRGGFDFKPIGLSPDDASWLDGQKMSVRDIATAFGIPSILLGDSESSTYANFENAQKYFYQTTVRYILDLIRDELNGFLLPMYPDGDSLYIDYCKSDVPELREDETSKQDSIRKSFLAGLITRDEARAHLGEPTIGGDIGSEIIVPRNTNSIAGT